MKGGYFACFWLLVLGIVRVDCSFIKKLRNMAVPNYRRPQHDVPVQQGSYEGYKGSIDQLGLFNAEWACTNAKRDKLFIGSQEMNQIRGRNSYPAQNGNTWNDGVYTTPQAHYSPQQSPGNLGFSYQEETPKQYNPEQQLPPNSQQGHQNPQQLSPPSNSQFGQDQPKPGSTGFPAGPPTTTHTNSQKTDDISFNNLDWTAFAPAGTTADAKEIVNTGEGILQPRQAN